MLLLGIWLVAHGINLLRPFFSPAISKGIAILAVVTGVVILVSR